MKKYFTLTWVIFYAMLLGIIVGWVVNKNLNDSQIKSFADNVSVLTMIFMRLIKMIIAPLILTTLTVGIAKMGDMKTVGRIGGKALLWFLLASLFSLTLGMIVMNLTQLGVGLNLPIPESLEGMKTTGITFVSFLKHVFPESVIDAMAKNEILQVVVFSLFIGVAAASIGKKAEGFINVLDSAAHIILKVTSYVMNFAPFAAFSALAAVIALNGPDILTIYLKLFLTFMSCLVILWIVLIIVAYFYIGKRVFALLKAILDCFLLAFSTASSEAAFPLLIEELEKFGCNKKIVTFVLPIGYSFNLDGSMMYTTFASLFIAQAYNIHLSFTQQISMLLLMMVTSKGIAGTPRASLLVVASTLSAFNIPEAGLALILGVDQIFDMARTGTNVIGNSIATTCVCKMENELSEQRFEPVS